MIKNVAWVLLGVVIGVGGYYVATWTPRSKVMQPDSPAAVAMMLTQAIDDNSLYALHNLMTPQQSGHFTGSDLRSLRQYVKVNTKAEAGSSIDTYTVITFGNTEAITLWLAPPMGKNHFWQIQKITKGAKVGNAYNLP